MTNNDWDCIAKINDTDLYGLLNILLERSGEKYNLINTLNNIKYAFGVNKEEPPTVGDFSASVDKLVERLNEINDKKKTEKLI